jgi:hypothetical protein
MPTCARVRPAVKNENNEEYDYEGREAETIHEDYLEVDVFTEGGRSAKKNCSTADSKMRPVSSGSILV